MLATAVMRDDERIRQIDALLKYHFGYKQKYLDSLSDRAWAELYQDLVWIKKQENREQ